MTRTCKLALAAMMAFMLAPRGSSNGQTVPSGQKPQLLNYVWYKDEELNEPTGTVSSIDTELNRLRELFPSSVFSTSSSMSLSAYEWGQYPNQVLAIIYSDR